MSRSVPYSGGEQTTYLCTFAPADGPHPHTACHDLPLAGIRPLSVGTPKTDNLRRMSGPGDVLEIYGSPLWLNILSLTMGAPWLHRFLMETLDYPGKERVADGP